MKKPMQTTPLFDRLQTTLATLTAEGNHRRLDVIDRRYRFDFSHNDYLGIAQDTALQTTFTRQFLTEKTTADTAFHSLFSASSSRLLGGSQTVSQSLEATLADLYRRPALFLNSGYHANVGLLPALAGKKDLIIADKLVHASLIDGIRLSDADFRRYPHLDNDKLSELLDRYQHDYETIFIVTESLFSMDGDCADLTALVALKNRYDNVVLYVDEAHAVGTFGERGLGLAEHQGVVDDIDILVLPCGKAVASVGAVVIASQTVKDYVINHARPLIFSTALPPISLAWTAFVFERLADFSEKRRHLQRISRQFCQTLNITSDSFICPLIVGENARTVALSHALKSHDILALPIRHPTVAKGTARLRFSLNATISETDIEYVTEHVTHVTRTT